MTDGEDVYDVAQWCHICKTRDHPACEPLDLRFECFHCHERIEEGEEKYESDDDTESVPYHKQCLRTVLRRRNMDTQSTYSRAPKNRKRMH